MTAAIQQYGLGGSGGAERKPRWWYAALLVCLSVFCMALATQRVASYFDFHPALGKPLVAGFYAPWAVFFWKVKFLAQDSFGFMETAVTHSQALFLIPQFLIIGTWLFVNPLKGNAQLHGSARWASEKEIRAMGYFDGAGVYIGGYVRRITGAALLWYALLGKPKEVQMYLRHNGPEHLLVFAPTRSGKGIGLILPTLLAWEGSSLVLDIKGENWALTSGFRRSMGQKVLRFDPADASGASACFNPLEELRLDSLLSIPNAQNIAAMLVDPEGKGLEDHWSKAAFAMLGGSLLHCCIMTRAREKRAATLYDLSCMLADETRTIQQLFEEMVAAPHAALLKEIFPQNDDAEYGAKAHTFIASSAREMLNKAESVTCNSNKDVYVFLSFIFKLLPDILTGYIASKIHQNSCPLLVHLLVRFWRSFRRNIVENKGLSAIGG